METDIIKEHKHSSDKRSYTESKKFRGFASENTSVKETIALTLQHWPWVIVSVFVFVVIGVIYLLVTPKTYTQTASLVIKDESEGSSAEAVLNQLTDIGLFSSNSDVQNELEAFKSSDLMEEVVDKLDLTTTYYLQGKFHKIIAFGTTQPIKVLFPENLNKSSIKFKLDITGNDISLSNLAISAGKEKTKKYSKEYKGAFNTPIKTEIGYITVLPTAYYSKDKTPITVYVVKAKKKQTVQSFASKLKVEIQNVNSSVIQLKYKDHNIERADSILWNLIEVYNYNYIRDKNSISNQISQFIDDRLAVIENDLGNVDSKISAYKSSNLIPDLSMNAAKTLESDQELAQEILVANNRLQTLYRLRTLLSNKGNSYSQLPANLGLEDSGIQAQIASYNTKISERNRIISQSSEKNPLIRNIETDLNGLRMAISESVENAIATTEFTLSGLKTARQHTTQEIASNPTQAKDLLDKERQQKVKENLYLFLLQKQEDNNLSQAFTSLNNRILQKPGGSENPSSPRSSIVLFICVVIGIILPCILVYLIESLNTHVRGVQDLRDVKVPMLGEIPQLPHKEVVRFKDEAVVKAGNRDVINEAFRVLRTNINFARVNKTGCNVFSFTSFNPGSGKSFISYNLAVAFAIRNKRVLVIDADLRTGSLSKYVGSPENGLSEYLDGQYPDINQLLITPEGHPTLQVLPVGQIPPTPTELIERPEFARMIEKLREQYDLILIDCPPINIVADTKIIDQVVDRTIFVLRVGIMERSALPALDEINENGVYKKMAFILNGTPMPKDKYGRRYNKPYAYGN